MSLKLVLAYTGTGYNPAMFINPSDVHLFSSDKIVINGSVYRVYQKPDAKQGCLATGNNNMFSTTETTINLTFPDKTQWRDVLREVSIFTAESEIIPDLLVQAKQLLLNHLIPKKSIFYINNVLFVINTPISGFVLDQTQLILFSHRYDVNKDLYVKKTRNTVTKTEHDSSNTITPSEPILYEPLNLADLDVSTMEVGGLSSQMNQLIRRVFVTRALTPEKVEALAIKQVKGVIIYGPPGTGKT